MISNYIENVLKITQETDKQISYVHKFHKTIKKNTIRPLTYDNYNICIYNNALSVIIILTI